MRFVCSFKTYYTWNLTLKYQIQTYAAEYVLTMSILREDKQPQRHTVCRFLFHMQGPFSILCNTWQSILCVSQFSVRENAIVSARDLVHIVILLSFAVLLFRSSLFILIFLFSIWFFSSLLVHLFSLFHFLSSSLCRFTDEQLSSTIVYVGAVARADISGLWRWHAE
jgi:hypothetical protein